MFKGVIAAIMVFWCGQVMATDPTRPLTAGGASSSSAPKKGLQLQSIIASQNKQRVVISGKTLTIGDSIGEYTVIAINDNDVTLKSVEKTIKLSLFKRVISSNN